MCAPRSDYPKLKKLNEVLKEQEGAGWKRSGKKTCTTDTIPENFDPKSTDPSGGNVILYNTKY